jgi:hypothetical protein
MTGPFRSVATGSRWSYTSSVATGQDEEREGPDRFTFWVRFSTTFLVVSTISFLNIASDNLAIHLLTALGVGTVNGLVVARFGDAAASALLRRMPWWM